MPTIEQIEAMLIDNPNDTFLLYALAMELASQGELDRSLSIFGELIHLDVPYVPAFFMSSQQLVQLGRVAEAKTMLAAGIEHARKQQDDHAAAEMSEFLATLD